LPTPDVDAKRLIEALQRHDVNFVVIGGFAVELWDVAVQPTLDVDVTPENSPANLKKLASALNELKAEIRYGLESIAVPGGFTDQNLAGLMVLNLLTSAGPLDISLQPAGTGGYADLSQHRVDIDYQGVSVPTASLADVARSKEAAGRPKDLRILPAILAHLDRLERKPDSDE
jgi:hypothetical protein